MRLRNPGLQAPAKSVPHSAFQRTGRDSENVLTDLCIATYAMNSENSHSTVDRCIFKCVFQNVSANDQSLEILTLAIQGTTESRPVLNSVAEILGRARRNLAAGALS